MTSDAVNGRFVAGCRRLSAALPNFDNSLRQPLQQITGKLNRKLAEAGGSSFCSPGELAMSGTSEQRAHFPLEKGGALFPIGASALNSTLSSVGSARSEVLKHHRDIKKAVFGDGFQGLSRLHTKKPGGLSDENCPVIEKSTTRISNPAADKGISRQIAGDLADVSHGRSRSHTKISNPAADQGISLVSEAATDLDSEEMTLSEVGPSEYSVFDSPDDLSPRSTKSKIERFGISQVEIEELAEFHSVGKLMRICKLAKDQGTARTLPLRNLFHRSYSPRDPSELQLAKQFVKSSGGLYLKEKPVVRFDGEGEEEEECCEKRITGTATPNLCIYLSWIPTL